MYFKALLLLILIVAEQASCLPWPFFKPYWGPGRPYPFPFNSGKPYRPSPPCTRSCTVAKPKAATVIKGVTTPYDSGTDVLQAVRQCNPGGRVHFEKNQTYSIGTALDLTNLKNVDLDIQGTIKFTDNIDYWVTHSFKFQFQNISTFWVIGGHDVNVYGGGTIDGSGQTWWTAAAANTSLSAYRPALVGYIGFYGGSVSDLTLIQPPNWFHFVANATDVVFDGLNLTARGTGPTAAQNSDGWDTYRSDNIVIQNSVIQNGDDCVAFKPNSTNIIVQNLHCNGSHGISVGSLGQYAGEVDIVENIFIYNTSLSNATDGARIKVWPGISPAQVGLDGVGGGIGYVRNITYDTMHIDNDALDIELQQCYGAVSAAACSAYPSNMTISNVHFKNFWGVASKQNDPKVGSLVCSSPLVCSDIYASNITVTPPSGKSPQYTCTNVNVTELGLPCTKS